MAESLMYRLDFSVAYRKTSSGTDSHAGDPQATLSFLMHVEEGQPYVETAKQFMVGNGRYKTRVLKDDYMRPECRWENNKPSHSWYLMYAKTEDLLEAKKLAKQFMADRYDEFFRDSQLGFHSIMAYNPEAES